MQTLNWENENWKAAVSKSDEWKMQPECRHTDILENGSDTLQLFGCFGFFFTQLIDLTLS